MCTFAPRFIMLLKEYLPYYKRNLRLALPVMFSQAGQILVQQVDNAMVGAVGTLELAAASFANSVFLVGMVIGLGFSMGLTPLVGHAFGSKKTKECASLLHNSAILNTGISVLLVIVMYSVSFFMKQMGQTNEVAELAIPYYKILVASMIPFMFFYTIKQFSEGIGNTLTPMIITLIANVVNVIVNYLLIYGKLGFPQLGLTGAGIGTLISRVVMAGLFYYIFVKRDYFKPYLTELKSSKFDFAKITRLFNVGWPIAVQVVLEVFAFVFGAIMIGWLGEVPLAAHQIGIGLASVTFMIVSGVSSATTIRVAHQYSQKNYEGLSRASYASVHLVLAFMGTSAILFVLCRNLLPLIYTSDPAVIAVASQLILMAAAFQIFDGLQVVMLGILRGLADVKHAMVIAFISYILISLPLSYLFGFTFKMGAVGVWVGLVASLVIAATFFYRRYVQMYKRITEK